MKKIAVLVVYTDRGVCKFPLRYLRGNLNSDARDALGRASKIFLRYLDETEFVDDEL